MAFVAVLAASCAPATTGRPSDRNVITAGDIATAHVQTAWEAVERLQPQWLTSRGATSITDPTPTVASVFLNGVEVGDVDYLKSIIAVDVSEMRYYPPGEAGARFGMGHPRGVITVTTGNPRT
ncbi:MAG: hypothetical protein ACREL7_02000 [Longimicrobiales bacterium]